MSASSVNLTANALRTIDTQAKSTQGGATSGSTQTTGQQTLQQQDAKTSDGSLGLAAAVAVTNVTGDSSIEISTSGALSAGSAMAFNAGSTLAAPNGGITTLADGSNTSDNGTGIGAAAAINTANVTSRVRFSGATTLTAPGGVNAQATLVSSGFGAKPRPVPALPASAWPARWRSMSASPKRRRYWAPRRI